MPLHNQKSICSNCDREIVYCRPKPEFDGWWSHMATDANSHHAPTPKIVPPQGGSGTAPPMTLSQGKSSNFTGSTAEKTEPRKWEYFTHQVINNHDFIERDLKNLGESGWELVSVVPVTMSQNLIFKLFLKRSL